MKTFIKDYPIFSAIAALIILYLLYNMLFGKKSNFGTEGIKCCTKRDANCHCIETKLVAHSEDCPTVGCMPTSGGGKASKMRVG